MIGGFSLFFLKGMPMNIDFSDEDVFDVLTTRCENSRRSYFDPAHECEHCVEGISLTAKAEILARLFGKFIIYNKIGTAQ